MLAIQRFIDTLAERIERAYRHRRGGGRLGCTTPGIWSAAAGTLLQARELNDSVPLDPELFVAAQFCDSPFIDPWGELTGAGAIERYTARVTAIVRGLRRELAGEIRHANRRVAAGEAISKVLLSRDNRLSPLGRYIIAHRSSRPALANRFLAGALEQSRACPLYRQACSELLPAGAYPSRASGGPPAALPIAPATQPRGHSPRN